MDSENIIKSGAKRLRHGSYATAYRDNHGKGRYAYRGEVQRIDTRGLVRIRKWFNNFQDAWDWAHSKRHI